MFKQILIRKVLKQERRIVCTGIGHTHRINPLRKSDNMESERQNCQPRWIKPNLFIKIVGLYLLISKAIVVLLLIEIYQIWQTTSSFEYMKGSLNGVYLVPMLGVLLVWSTLSVVGSVKLFLLQKSGFFISLAAVFLTLIVFPSSYTLYLNFTNNFSSELINTQTNYAISSLTIACDITMIPLLLVSRKRVNWKS